MQPPPLNRIQIPDKRIPSRTNLSPPHLNHSSAITHIGGAVRAPRIRPPGICHTGPGVQVSFPVLRSCNTPSIHFASAIATATWYSVSSKANRGIG